MKYVVCVPDGCADEPLDALGGRTPLEVASMPTLRSLAGRGQVGRAAVIPTGPPARQRRRQHVDLRLRPRPSSTPAARRSRRRRWASSSAPTRSPTGATWSPSTRDGTMVDFAGGHPTSDDAAPIIKALDDATRRRGPLPSPASSTATSWWRRPTGSTPTARRRTTCPTRPRCTRPARPRRKLRRLMDASREVVGAFGAEGQPDLAVGPRLPAADAVVRRASSVAAPPSRAPSISCAAWACSPTSPWSTCRARPPATTTTTARKRDAALDALAQRHRPLHHPRRGLRRGRPRR